jgi:hypothetical protein
MRKVIHKGLLKRVEEGVSSTKQYVMKNTLRDGRNHKESRTVRIPALKV